MTSRSAKLPAATAASAPGAVQARESVVRAANVAHWYELLRAYIALMKPGIVIELLVIAVPAMVLAASGWPGLDLIALVLVGGVLTGGGANAINQWYDRDIDSKMARTMKRPLPMGTIAPRRALAWGLFLSVVGTLQLLLTVNWLSALLAASAIAFYVLIYTMWLKRTTVHNTVLGGIAGAAPPVVGWAAVTGDLGVAPLLLFAIVFFWQPPHFWALALRYKDEYAKAGIPMLPVVHGERETHRQSLIYSVLLLAVSVVLYATGDVGEIFLGAALVLGVGFVAQAWRLSRGTIVPMSLFFYSLVYLTVLFAALALDVAVL